MAECLACLGQGRFDFRDDDAVIAEQFLNPRAVGLAWPLGIVECDECEGTGTISEERYRDMMAVARAAVDQIVARLAVKVSW